MINLVSNSFMNNKQVNFKGINQPRKAPYDAKTAQIEERMNDVFGVTLDEFIKACDDRKFFNTYGVTQQEYYDDEYCTNLV